MCVLVPASPCPANGPRGTRELSQNPHPLPDASRASLQYVAHEGGTRTTAVAGGRLKVQTAYGDNVELVC